MRLVEQLETASCPIKVQSFTESSKTSWLKAATSRMEMGRCWRKNGCNNSLKFFFVSHHICLQGGESIYGKSFVDEVSSPREKYGNADA